MRPRLTTRGKVVLGIAIVGFLLGWSFGGRNLNVVVVPALALVAVSGLYVWRFDPPTVSRYAPTHGHRGETRRLDLHIESAIGYPATVQERTSTGLGGGERHHIITDGRWISEDITLEKRGRQTVGPTRVTARDPFALWEREFTYSKTETVLVFPEIRTLAGEGHLLREFVGLTDDRDRFDSVREYQPGDPLRDINWKASAKRPDDLVVTKYAGEGAVTRVMLAVEAHGAGTDTVAEAAASVAVFLLEAGLAVGLRTTDEYVEPGHGNATRREILGALALLEPGSLRDEYRSEADIQVVAPRNSQQVEIKVGADRLAYSDIRDPSGVIPA